MQTGMDELWIVINSLSFIVYLPLFKFIFPDNCQIVMESLLAVVTFDIIETLGNFGIDVIPFDFAETPAYNENFENLGYDSSNSFALFGTVNFLLFYMIIAFFLALSVKICVPCRETKFGIYVRNKFPFKG